ncbi:MAG TPA: hypothetical protein VFQ12_10605 [Thermoleophilaceae bacterium]|nr:hypothetical protein [Thermoleophilaceae bacterium]
MALCAALVLAVVGPAAADKEELAPVWATVNVCDPASNQVGVRVGAPGDGTDARIHARFTLQWYSEAQGAWLPVEGAASSPWQDVGSAGITSQQAGWTFQLDQPADGRTKQLRAVAQVQWRQGASVVRSSSAVTLAGAPSDVGGSQAVCEMS